MGNSGPALTHPADGGLRWSELLIYERVIPADRGRFPGHYQPCQHLVAAALASGTIFDNLDDLPGRRLLAVKISNVHYVYVDITGPWR